MSLLITIDLLSYRILLAFLRDEPPPPSSGLFPFISSTFRVLEALFRWTFLFFAFRHHFSISPPLPSIQARRIFHAFPSSNLSSDPPREPFRSFVFPCHLIWNNPIHLSRTRFINARHVCLVTTNSMQVLYELIVFKKKSKKINSYARKANSTVFPDEGFVRFDRPQ